VALTHRERELLFRLSYPLPYEDKIRGVEGPNARVLPRQALGLSALSKGTHQLPRAVRQTPRQPPEAGSG